MTVMNKFIRNRNIERSAQGCVSSVREDACICTKLVRLGPLSTPEKRKMEHEQLF